MLLRNGLRPGLRQQSPHGEVLSRPIPPRLPTGGVALSPLLLHAAPTHPRSAPPVVLPPGLDRVPVGRLRHPWRRAHALPRADCHRRPPCNWDLGCAETRPVLRLPPPRGAGLPDRRRLVQDSRGEQLRGGEPLASDRERSARHPRPARVLQPLFGGAGLFLRAHVLGRVDPLALSLESVRVYPD